MKKIYFYLFLLSSYIDSNNLVASESSSSVSSSSTSSMQSSSSSGSSSSSSSQTINENFLNAVIDDLDMKIIEELIKSGADVNYNREGIDIIAKDFDITKESNRCNPPLSYAIINQNEKLVSRLVMSGASSFYIDIFGNDPYEIAQSKGFKRETLRGLEASKSLVKNRQAIIVGLVSRLNKNETPIKVYSPLEYPNKKDEDIFIYTTEGSFVLVFNNEDEIKSECEPKYKTNIKLKRF